MGPNFDLKCFRCGSIDIEQLIESAPLCYKSVDIKIDIHYCICKNCEHEFIPVKMRLLNDEIVRNAKQLYDETYNTGFNLTEYEKL